MVINIANKTEHGTRWLKNGRMHKQLAGVVISGWNEHSDHLSDEMITTGQWRSLSCEILDRQLALVSINHTPEIQRHTFILWWLTILYLYRCVNTSASSWRLCVIVTSRSVFEEGCFWMCLWVPDLSAGTTLTHNKDDALCENTHQIKDVHNVISKIYRW